MRADWSRCLVGDGDLGKQSDHVAINRSSFNDDFTAKYGAEKRPKALITKNAGVDRDNQGTDAPFLLMGDQGYPLMDVPANTDLLLTRSVESAGEEWAKARHKQYIRVSPFVSKLRVVIERLLASLRCVRRCLAVRTWYRSANWC